MHNHMPHCQVREALFNKAMFLYTTGEREAAQAAFKATEDKTAGVGQKLDCTFAVLRYVDAAWLRGCTPPTD